MRWNFPGTGGAISVVLAILEGRRALKKRSDRSQEVESAVSRVQAARETGAPGLVVTPPTDH